MRGYGRHTIKNNRGEIMVVFDVQPLKMVTARSVASGDSPKRLISYFATPTSYEQSELSLTGTFQGRVQVRDETGRQVDNYIHSGSNRGGTLRVAFRRANSSGLPASAWDFHRDLTGNGRHEIRDEYGKIIGSITMTQLPH